MASLFVLALTLLVVLASSTCGDRSLVLLSFAVQTITPQSWGRAGTGGSRFARGDKEPRPQLGNNNYPELFFVKPPKRDTRALSPAGLCGDLEKALLRLALQKSRPHAPLAPMRSTPAYFFCKGGGL
jgi:hypothetical protein